MKVKIMNRSRQHLSTLVVGLLGFGSAGLGCSDGAADPDGAGGLPASAGTSSAVSGSPSTAGQAAQAGSANGGSSSAGAAAVTAGTANATGGNGGGNGGSSNGGSSDGGASVGTAGRGGSAGATAMGGSSNGGSAMGGAGTGAGGGQSTGTCTASKATGKTVSGTGPHQVVIETNSENGIKCGTIYRPKDLGGANKYPILVWGEGGCSQDGYSNQAAMGEIASWGYFIVADGTPGSANACAGGQNGKAFLDYITWAIAENGKSCSAYYQSLETTKIAADGFSCGGLMSENASGDPRFAAIGITSSGLMAKNDDLYKKIHTPFKIMNGGTEDIAYKNGLNDYDAISALGKPILYLSKNSAGHGGDLGNGRGDFNQVNLAWLNWQLKGDMGATGKGFLVGDSCKYCNNAGWTFKSANLP
jgi:hypothetical protein